MRNNPENRTAVLISRMKRPLFLILPLDQGVSIFLETSLLLESNPFFPAQVVFSMGLKTLRPLLHRICRVANATEGVFL